MRGNCWLALLYTVAAFDCLISQILVCPLTMRAQMPICIHIYIIGCLLGACAVLDRPFGPPATECVYVCMCVHPYSGAARHCHLKLCPRRGPILSAFIGWSLGYSCIVFVPGRGRAGLLLLLLLPLWSAGEPASRFSRAGCSAPWTAAPHGPV